MLNHSKKILITAPFSTTGGVFWFVNSIHDCFEAKVYLFRRGSKDKQNKINKGLTNVLMPFRFFFTLLLKKYDYIIINSSLSKQSLLRDGVLVIISKLFFKKVLLIIHGFQENALKNRFLLKNGYFKANSITVLSSTFSEKIKNCGYKKPVYVLFNPVSQEIINSFKNVSEADLNRRSKNILFLSRIEEAKGVFICIEAFEKALKKEPTLTLTIAGSGSLLNKAKDYILEKKIRNVVFSGYVIGENKIELLHNADVFLFPSFNEGLPINVLEAMAAGLTIVTRPVGGLVDLHKKINFGFIEQSKNADAFANILIEIVENQEKYSSIRHKNLLFAHEYFSPQSIVQQISTILNSFDGRH